MRPTVRRLPAIAALLLALAGAVGTAGAQDLARGVAQAESGDVAGALRTFEALAARDPRDQRALLWGGLMLERLGQYSEARRRWGEVVLDPHWGTTAAYLSTLSHWRQGEFSSNVRASAGFCVRGRPKYEECQGVLARFTAGERPPAVERWADLVGLTEVATAERAQPAAPPQQQPSQPPPPQPTRPVAERPTERPTERPMERPAAPANAGATLRLAKDVYRAGETIAIAFRGPGGYMDEVALWQVDGARPAKRTGKFVWGAREGTIEFVAPRPGRYEARYEPAATNGPGVLATAAVRVEAAAASAPATAAATIPSGTYETYFHGVNAALTKWLAGDIVVRDGGAYAFQGAAGRYGLDPASQRIVFHSGRLQGVFARLASSSGRPAIVLPRRENEAIGKDLQIVSDVWGYLKR